jgi:drug/metabolite transporter (DMT)-like permease
MSPTDTVRLVVLAAIWGAAFVFARVLAPAIGPVATADLRILIAGIVLTGWLIATGLDFEWRRFWPAYLVTGIFNSAVPGLLYAYAALHIPAGHSAILNATAPLFGALLAPFWLGERLTRRRLAGLALGIAGVALLGLRPGSSPATASASAYGLAIGACLLAAFCYAIAGIYVRRRAHAANPMAMAGASQLLPGLALLPALGLAPPAAPFTPMLVANLLGLAILCGAIAYVLYYRLIASAGPTRALTVTFLIPLFGMLWAALFLGEAVTLPMAAGCALIVAGTWLVVRESVQPNG